MRRFLKVAIALLAVVVLAGWWLTAPQTLDAADLPEHTPDPAAGERVFWAGGCASCHASPVDGTRAKGEDKLLLGGGLELESPYGAFPVPNISPHADGIGGWSTIEFVNAMQRGVSPEGMHYYPAFPYTSYARMRIEDIIDLKAYLDTLPVVAGQIAGPELAFPWSVRRGIGAWKRRYLDAAAVVAVAATDDAVIRGRELVEAVFTETARIDELMSTYKEASRISDINRRAADEPVDAGPELYKLIQQSLDMSVLTRGAFDITYDSVGQYYDFRNRQRPDAATIEAERSRIDFRLVKLDPVSETVHFLEPGVRINLGGIAKGYVVERGVEVLRRGGVENAIVTAGGDSRLLGDRRGRPFMIGIRDPRVEGEVAISVPLEDEAISTSGDYERYFEEDGVRYHHIIKPSTGMPSTGVHSATVFGPDAVMTDALSTSVFVMGVDLGLRLIAGLPDYESIVIDADGRIFYSDGLQTPE